MTVEGMVKVRDVSELDAGEVVRYRQARADRGLRVLRIEDGIIVAEDEETHVVYELDPSDKNRRWALYKSTGLPPEAGDHGFQEVLSSVILEMRKALAMLEARIENKPSPPVEQPTEKVETLGLAKEYADLIKWVRNERNVMVANMEGGYARIAPHAFKTWCRKAGVAWQDLHRYAVENGLLHLDTAGGHPKSNRAGVRLMKFSA